MRTSSVWFLFALLAAALLTFVVLAAAVAFSASLPEHAAILVTVPGMVATFSWLALVRRMGKTDASLSFLRLTIGTLVLAIPLVLLPPAGSTDVFAYGYFGRLVAEHGINPYLVQSNETIPESLLLLTGAPAPFPSPYGPLWTAVSAGAAWLTDGDAAFTLLLFRLLALGALLGTTWMLADVCKRLTLPLRHVALFVWQPFVLFETVNNAHNEALMLFGIVAAVWLAVRGHAAWALPTLALAAAVKFSALAALLVLLRPNRHGAHATSPRLGTWTAILVSVVLVISLFLPFWGGLPTLRGLLQVGTTFSVPFYHPVWLFARLFGLFGLSSSAAQHAGYLLGVLLFLCCAAALYLRREKNAASLPAAVGISLLAFALLGVQFFQPWYLLWGMPLLALLPLRQATVVTAALGTIGFLTYAVF